jgi:hypothetical protein
MGGDTSGRWGSRVSGWPKSWRFQRCAGARAVQLGTRWGRRHVPVASAWRGDAPCGRSWLIGRRLGLGPPPVPIPDCCKVELIGDGSRLYPAPFLGPRGRIPHRRWGRDSSASLSRKSKGACASQALPASCTRGSNAYPGPAENRVE